MSDLANHRALQALLDWYVESGVDIALDDAPHDRYAESARAPAPVVEIDDRRKTAEEERARQAPRTPRREAPQIIAPDAAAQAARETAAAAHDLDDLAARLAAFKHAPFSDMARHFHFSAGTPGARLMAFDVAPGAIEEAGGEAFSGLSAKLLDNMLAAISRARAGAYLAYLSPWRPPGDKSLTPHETAIFAPFARRHVELAQPEILLLFGEAPARALIETNEPASKLRGKCFDIRCGDHAARAFVFSNLDAMLKSAALKPAAWRDLRAVASALG